MGREVRRKADRKPSQGFEQISNIIMIILYFSRSTLVPWRLDYTKARMGIKKAV